jgi:hypothetical protein
MFVMIPLFCMLCVKLREAYTWWYEQRRTKFHNYYFASTVFYITFIIQMTLILLTSKDDLSNQIIKLTLWLIILCIPLNYILHL